MLEKTIRPTQVQKQVTETYEKICIEINKLPDWKKEVYNNNFAISANAKKIPSSCKLS